MVHMMRVSGIEACAICESCFAQGRAESLESVAKALRDGTQSVDRAITDLMPENCPLRESLTLEESTHEQAKF